MNDLQWVLALGAAASCATCLAVVMTKDRHGHLSLDSTIGVQKFHEAPTPRVGGVGIVAGLVLGLLIASAQLRAFLLPIALAGAPAFVVGLWEDLTKRVSVRARLTTTMACGVLAWLLTGTTLTRVNVTGVDTLLATALPLSVAFTAFAVSGAANAFNIIDGFNGLSGGVAIVCLAALSAIAYQVGDVALAQTCLLVAFVSAGFLLVNFPFGKIFLGDGGAYFLGFVIGWIAVSLPMRNPAVSVWATLLACAYPILETGFSIVRRRKRDLSPGDPDRLHLHSLVQRRVVRRLLPHGSALTKNSMTGALMWAAAVVPATLATAYHDNTPLLAFAFGLCALAYSGLYARLTQFRWCFRPATLAAETSAA